MSTSNRPIDWSAEAAAERREYLEQQRARERAAQRAAERAAEQEQNR